jgi:hypothetical protein
MPKIKCEQNGHWFEVKVGKNYQGKVYEPGSMIISGCPFFGVPLALDLSITPAGEILFRGWRWVDGQNTYFHTTDRPENVEVTPEMQSTISGLFSGRILYEGIKIAIGASIQKLCPLDLEREERLIGRKIYLV